MGEFPKEGVVAKYHDCNRCLNSCLDPVLGQSRQEIEFIVTKVGVTDIQRVLG